jgi:FSR family fosmidomycin resistance protein-like MFS transporter
VAALAFIGAATVATFSVTVVMGQEYLPNRLGIASGVTLGLSIGLGGAGAAVLGALADEYGLRTALEIVAVLPLPALILALTLPEGRRISRAGASSGAREAAALTSR